jgi:hypothetical protein
MAEPRHLAEDERIALDAVAAMRDDEIDLRDAPEVEEWSGAIRGKLAAREWKAR